MTRILAAFGFMRSALAGIMLVSLSATTWAAQGTTPVFSQNFGDLKEEASAAKEESKIGVMIMFEQADCPWCDKMMNTVLNQASVIDYYTKHFRSLQVDIKGDNPLTDFQGDSTTEKDFAFKHRVRATPVFAFFDTNGKFLTKYTGATRTPEEFVLLGEFVASGKYRNSNFTAYKRERGAPAK